MTAVLESPSADATNVAKAALEHLLERKRAQGYAVESRTDSEAIVVIKGRKRWFRPSIDHRQHVAFDEHGAVSVTKLTHEANQAD